MSSKFQTQWKCAHTGIWTQELGLSDNDKVIEPSWTDPLDIIHSDESLIMTSAVLCKTGKQ